MYVMCNLWDFDYISCGLLVGVVVMVVVGVLLVLYGSDGGGLIWILVGCCGVIGLKVLCGIYLILFYGLDFILVVLM